MVTDGKSRIIKHGNIHVPCGAIYCALRLWCDSDSVTCGYPCYWLVPVLRCLKEIDKGNTMVLLFILRSGGGHVNNFT